MSKSIYEMIGQAGTKETTEGLEGTTDYVKKKKIHSEKGLSECQNVASNQEGKDQ